MLDEWVLKECDSEEGVAIKEDIVVARPEIISLTFLEQAPIFVLELAITDKIVWNEEDKAEISHLLDSLARSYLF